WSEALGPERSLPEAGSCLHLLFELELSFILFQKGAQLVCVLQQPDPLFVIQCHGKPAQAVHADAALFTYTEFERSGAASGGLLFQLCQTGLELFIGWFCHWDPLVSKNLG